MAHKGIGKCESQWETHSKTMRLFTMLWIIEKKNDSYTAISNNLQKELFERLSICLYVIIKSRTSFRVDPHSAVCQNVTERLAKAGAISEV